MKKILFITSMAFCFYNCQKSEQYYALFREYPELHGKIPVYLGKQQIGFSKGAIKREPGGHYILSIEVDRQYCPLIQSNTHVIAANGILEIRLCPDEERHALQPGSSLKGFVSEWGYQAHLISLKSSDLLQRIQLFFHSHPQ